MREGIPTDYFVGVMNRNFVYRADHFSKTFDKE